MMGRDGKTKRPRDGGMGGWRDKEIERWRQKLVLFGFYEIGLNALFHSEISSGLSDKLCCIYR